METSDMCTLFIDFVASIYSSFFKESDFQELQPSCLSLMTDVFGNYVIQVTLFLSLLPLPTTTVTMTTLPYRCS